MFRRPNAERSILDFSLARRSSGNGPGAAARRTSPSPTTLRNHTRFSAVSRSSFVSKKRYGKILFYGLYHAPNWKSRPRYVLAAQAAGSGNCRCRLTGRGLWCRAYDVAASRRKPEAREAPRRSHTSVHLMTLSALVSVVHLGRQPSQLAPTFLG